MPVVNPARASRSIGGVSDVWLGCSSCVPTRPALRERSRVRHLDLIRDRARRTRPSRVADDERWPDAVDCSVRQRRDRVRHVDDDGREDVEVDRRGIGARVRAVLRARAPVVAAAGRERIGQAQAGAAVARRDAVARKYLVREISVRRDVEDVAERPNARSSTR